MKLKTWKKLLVNALVLTCVVSPFGAAGLTARAVETEEVQINEPPIIEEGTIIDWNTMEPGSSAQAQMRVNTPSRADIVRYFWAHNILHEYSTAYDVQP